MARGRRQWERQAAHPLTHASAARTDGRTRARLQAAHPFPAHSCHGGIISLPPDAAFEGAGARRHTHPPRVRTDALARASPPTHARAHTHIRTHTQVPFRPEYERVRLTQKHSAFIRVAEGCDHQVPTSPHSPLPHSACLHHSIDRPKQPPHPKTRARAIHTATATDPHASAGAAGALVRRAGSAGAPTRIGRSVLAEASASASAAARGCEAPAEAGAGRGGVWRGVSWSSGPRRTRRVKRLAGCAAPRTPT